MKSIIIKQMIPLVVLCSAVFVIAGTDIKADEISGEQIVQTMTENVSSKQSDDETTFDVTTSDQVTTDETSDHSQTTTVSDETTTVEMPTNPNAQPTGGNDAPTVNHSTTVNHSCVTKKPSVSLSMVNLKKAKKKLSLSLIVKTSANSKAKVKIVIQKYGNGYWSKVKVIVRKSDTVLLKYAKKYSAKKKNKYRAVIHIYGITNKEYLLRKKKSKIVKM